MAIPAPIGVTAAGLPNAGDQANAVLSDKISAVGPTASFAFRGPMNLMIWASINTALTTTAGSLAATVASAAGLAAGAAINSVNVPRGATAGALTGSNVTLALPPVTYQAKLTAGSAMVTLPPGSNVARLLGAAVTVPSTAEGITLPAGTTVASVFQNDVAPSLNAQGVPGIIVLSNIPTAVPTNKGPQPLQFAPNGNAIVTTGADAAAIFTGAGVEYSATIQLERSPDGGATFGVCNIGGSGALAPWAAGTPVSLTFGEPEKEFLYRLNAIAYSSGVINYRISQTGGAAESLAIGPLSGG